MKWIDGDIDDAGDEAHQYVYDGGDIVLVFDENAELTNRYLHGPAVDQVLADEQYGATNHDDPTEDEGIVYWPLADNQGSVRQLVTSDGEQAARFEYDSFGQMTVASGTVDHIFGYTGREHDAESHLQFNRARYHDAALGRWISEDPIGFAAGDENLSRYVGNGPTNATDPSGLRDYGVTSGMSKEEIDDLNERNLRERYPNGRPMPMPGVLDRMDKAIKDLVDMVKDIESQLDDLTPEDRAAMIGVLQTVLDIVGIFEPTPFCDLGSGYFSYEQSDWWGVVFSGVAVIPWAGDVAKILRIGKWLDRINDALRVAKNSEKFRDMLRPLMKKLDEVLAEVPLDDMPDAAGNAIKQVRKKLDEFFKGTGDAATSKRPGTRGHPDHQADVNGPGREQARDLARPGERVETEGKVVGHDGVNRKADNQVIDKEGKTRVVVESERRPNGSYHKKRVKELEDAGIEVQTRPIPPRP